MTRGTPYDPVQLVNTIWQYSKSNANHEERLKKLFAELAAGTEGSNEEIMTLEKELRKLREQQESTVSKSKEDGQWMAVYFLNA